MLSTGLAGLAYRGLVSHSSSVEAIGVLAAVQWPSLLGQHIWTTSFTAAPHQPQQLTPQHTGSRSISVLATAAGAAAAALQPCLSAAAMPFSSHHRSLPHILQQQRQPLLLPLLGQPHHALQPQHHHHHQLLPAGVRTFVLMPRRIKYRKAHKSVGFNETICGNTRQLAFGLYGIRALEHCRIPARTLEAVRRTMRRTVKKTAMMWIRVTPNVPVTSKPAEVRMGKGKGTLDYWAAPIRPGQIIFELDRCSKATAMQAMQAIQAKMPIKIGFVEWN